jgi:hypothetical protein
MLNRFVTGLCLICCCSLLHSQTQEERKVSALIEKIKSENKIVEELTDNNLTNLPVGIKKTISGTTIIIAIDSAVITPRGMIINAYTQIIIPGAQRPISFALNGGIITPSGLSTEGPTRLEMLTECRIPFNDQVTLMLPSDGRNYVEWDCFGFRSVNLSGFFEFSPEFFIPDDPKDGKVIAGFEVNTTDLNNILVSTSITPFRIKGLSDMSFAVRNAVVDMSDFVNCDGFKMPSGYKQLFPDAPQLWRGFFLKEATILLPSELGKTGKRTSINASNLLIDEFGVSGQFEAENVLALEEGSASGWPFSVKSINITLIRNKITAGGLTGFLGIPFIGNEPVGYEAQVLSRNERIDFSFSVKSTESREFSVPFGGTVRLDKGCIVNVKSDNGRFLPSAILNGTMFLSGDSANIGGLRFERLHLLAESPYITGGKFESAAGTSFSLGGFGISVDSISLGIRSGKASLGMNARVALMNKSDKGVSAATHFFINAVVKKEKNPEDPGIDRQRWAYDGMSIGGVKVKGNISVFSLYGNVFLFNNHPVYGNGFRGEVGFTAGKILKDTAEVEVYFGKKPEFKYWYARVEIPVKINIGAVTLTSIGGGAYSNMERVNLYDTRSDYVPSQDAGLGFLASAGLYVKSEKIFNADATFEIAINKNGGVRFIRFLGEGRFFSKEEETKVTNVEKPSSPPAARADISMVFDNENNCFHANLSVYMNIYNALRGIGPGDLLGEAVIHSDPVDWYVYIGRPSRPLGAEVLGLLKVQTYFMAGTIIEDMPLPPSEVSSIITGIDLDFMKNERSIGTGKGLGFGVQFKASAGIGKDGGFVYAYLNAGAGADIMLKDYGEARCEGRSGPIGIDGWYASGQGYAYLTGKVGIRVKKSEFDIMSVAAALLIQAKMPNPSWFRGAIAARYSILGGLVKGKVNVSVVLGEECVLVTNGNELGDLKLIGDISPADNSQEVDVFAAPQVSFNTTVDKEFGMMNLNDEYAVYRVKLDEFKVRARNQDLPGTLQWNPAHDMATLVLRDILPGKEQITASVRIHIEKKSSSGWQALEGDPETGAAKFVTSDEPKSIPASNIAYSYPLNNQYNYYKSEYPHGYIKLLRGQPGLFEGGTEKKWDYLVRFKSKSLTLESPISYSISDAMLNFNIPESIINSAVYEMTIIKRPVSSEGVDRNLIRSQKNISALNEGDSLSLATTEITAAASSSLETALYSLSFRTSKFSSFDEKMRAMRNWRNQIAIDNKSLKSSLMTLLYLRATSEEAFDDYETRGIESKFGPLVSLEASRGNPWVDGHVYPLVYELYGSDGITLDRNTEILGLFPSRAMFISNKDIATLLLNGTDQNTDKGDIYLKYFVPAYVSSDYYELLNKAASRYMNQYEIPPPQAQRLLSGDLKDISKGDYPFRICYRLPGTNTITYSRNMSFTY